MNVRKRRDLPAPLEGVRRRFEQWRRTHKARARNSQPALDCGGEDGRHVPGLRIALRGARFLIEYYSLVEERVGAVRIRASKEHEASPGTRIPGIAASPCRLPPGDCTLELEDTAGSKMRVHLKAASPPRHLMALCRSFWNPVP